MPMDATYHTSPCGRFGVHLEKGHPCRCATTEGVAPSMTQEQDKNMIIELC